MSASNKTSPRPFHSSCASARPGIILQDYNSRSHFSQYKGATPRKHLQFNINYCDHNILNLPNRTVTSPNGKAVMFMPDSSLSPPRTNNRSLSQSTDFKITEKVTDSGTAKYSLAHYTKENGEREDFAARQEDLIHRQSNVPLSFTPNQSVNEFRKEWAPFSGAMLVQHQRQQPPKESLSHKKNIISSPTPEPKSGKEVRETLESKFDRFYKCTTPRLVIEGSEFLSPTAPREVSQSKPRCQTAAGPTPIASPTGSPEKLPARHRGSEMCAESDQATCMPLQVKLDEGKTQLEKVKETLESHMKTLKERKAAAATHSIVNAKKRYKSSAVAACMGCVPLKSEEVQQRLIKGDNKGVAEISGRENEKLALEGKEFTLLSEKFGIEHGRVRENERELGREEMRQALVVPELVKLQGEYDNRKDKLIVENEGENPLALGKYAETRARAVKQYNRNLKDQIVQEIHRKHMERSNERQIDKLRSECAVLQYEAEKAEENATRRGEVDSAQKQRREFLMQETQRKKAKGERKLKEKEHVEESEQDYRESAAVYAQNQTELKSQLSRQLGQQIVAKKTGRTNKTPADCSKQNVKAAKEKASTTRHQRTTSQPSMQASLLKGMECPHGKMYVCAFCARDQEKATKRKR